MWLCLVFSDCHTVDATLTVKPVNTVAVAGRSVTLPCTTDQSGPRAQIAWTRNSLTSSDRIVNFNCQPNSTFPQYSVNSSSAGQCDLVINAASLALAATYRCADSGFNTADAELTVIGEICIFIITAASAHAYEKPLYFAHALFCFRTLHRSSQT